MRSPCPSSAACTLSFDFGQLWGQDEPHTILSPHCATSSCGLLQGPEQALCEPLKFFS